MKIPGTLLLLAALAAPAQAGLHYSGETQNPLPARWPGFLTDHRLLRALAVPQLDTSRRSALTHGTYADALLKLENAGRTLTADELADRGALLVRLGQPAQAVEVLRPAARLHPAHFRLAANLGTAWQVVGDLDQAAAALTDAVRLAPPAWAKLEEAHLTLVKLRAKEGKIPLDAPDALFPAGAKPAETIPVLQQLALWLPADGRLLWHLGESAHAAEDVRTAANILDGCVAEFAMKSPTLRAHRQTYRDAADEIDKKPDHVAKGAAFGFKSVRPLARTFDVAKLPKPEPNGVTPLPWAALAETTIARPFRPQFLDYVKALNGKKVAIIGYVRPADGSKDAAALTLMLTEYPVGCWFCDVPDATALMAVDLATALPQLPRGAVTVTGTLTLNTTDPESYLVTLTGATIGVAD